MTMPLVAELHSCLDASTRSISRLAEVLVVDGVPRALLPLEARMAGRARASADRWPAREG